MAGSKCIALIAHDQKKDAMAEFARRNAAALTGWHIVATGTTATSRSARSSPPARSTC